MTGTSARAEIEALLVSYAAAIDERDWNSLSACFAADATGDYGPFGFFPDRSGIVNAISEAVTILDATQHMVTNFRVTISGDVAHSVCYFCAQHVRRSAGDAELFTVGGIYTDDLILQSGQWVIQERVMTELWTAGDPQVVGGVWRDD